MHPSPKYKWRVQIGSWSLTQWLKFIVVVAAVAFAANYITSDSGRSKSANSTGEQVRANDGREFIGEVVYVVDGDTLDVLRGGDRERVRLFGIDCPELKQSYGDKARRFAADTSLHKRVAVRTHGKDKYGRVLGDIVLDDGRVLNRELVKVGLAWWYWKYSDDADLRQLEQEARSRRDGLWADSSPVPPWEFRNGH